MTKKEEIQKFKRKQTQNILVGTLTMFGLLIAVSIMRIIYNMSIIDIISVSMFLSAFGMAINIITNNYEEWAEWKKKK